jgi:hypothetical protein
MRWDSTYKDDRISSLSREVLLSLDIVVLTIDDAFFCAVLEIPTKDSTDCEAVEAIKDWTGRTSSSFP